MKYFWALVGALIVTALVLLFNPTHVRERVANDEDAATAAGSPPTLPVPLETSTEKSRPANQRPVTAGTPVELIRRIDARTIELAGKYQVTGNGTQADPYRVSWELLMSASTTIDASTGALTPPKWVALLDGMWIEISAYYSTVARKQFVDELLLTFNRWDGCCIGLPPTPFDSIEVKLHSPMPLTGLHLTRFGTFRGQLHVSPLAVGGFLLSFYQLTDCSRQ